MTYAVTVAFILHYLFKILGRPLAWFSSFVQKFHHAIHCSSTRSLRTEAALSGWWVVTDSHVKLDKCRRRVPIQFSDFVNEGKLVLTLAFQQYKHLFFNAFHLLLSQTGLTWTWLHPCICMNYMTYLLICISPRSVWSEPWSFHSTSSTSGTSWACHSWQPGRWAHVSLYTRNSPLHTRRHTLNVTYIPAIPLSCTLHLTLMSRHGATNGFSQIIVQSAREEDGLSFIWFIYWQVNYSKKYAITLNHVAQNAYKKASCMGVLKRNILPTPAPLLPQCVRAHVCDRKMYLPCSIKWHCRSMESSGNRLLPRRRRGCLSVVRSASI